MLLIKLFHISRSERKPSETNLGAESFCYGSCRSIARKAGAAVEVCVSVGRGFGRKLDLCGETSSNPDKDKLKMMAKKLRGRPAMMINLLN